MSHEQKLLATLRKFALVALAVGAVFLWLVQWGLTHPRKQPIAFSHQVHVGKDQINCFYCHTGAQKGNVAGIIAVQDCMQCHQVVATDNPEVQKLHGYWNKKQPIYWEKVYKMPEHVQFSHQVHVAFLSRNNPEALMDPGPRICIRCHGDVSKMGALSAPASPVTWLTGNMNPVNTMGFCVNCHRQHGGPMDCTACHR